MILRSISAPDTSVARLPIRSAIARFAATVAVCLSGAAMASAENLIPQQITSYEQLQAAVKELATKPFTPQPELPESLKNIDYDQFRQIGFIDGKELWGDGKLPFRLGFYHKGYVAVDDVFINLVEDKKSVPVPFSKKYFHYLRSAANWKIPDDLGFAGFRVQGKFPGQKDFTEIFSYVGASYFRARAMNTVLGTSARGLAINCGLPKTEEFPIFREYWIMKPQPGDTSLRALALMDSPSVAGAYAFVMTPGIEKTDIEVRETLYFRQTPEKVGIAPMSSMWLWGDALPGPKGDHRPEVHDSDGLQIQAADGRWLWRTLGQQNYPSLVHLKYDAVRGFGLIQRDTDPKHYLDDEARYDARPSVWIQPQSDWGPGAVELLELPAPHEGIDNIAAWWVPAKPIVPGEPVDLSYRISFFSGDRPDHDLAKGVAHRVTRQQPGQMQVEIDFRGPLLAERSEANPPNVQVVSIRAAVTSTACRKLADGTWTAVLDVKPTGEGPFELMVFLKDGERELTETWAYLCPLDPPAVSLPPWKIKAEDGKESAK
ncbi:glucan biosynthesis protein G [Planctomicrobium piriforme]|nr:glucan biosynthesis protein G [Planctomicrobium piriforme]